MLHLKKLLAAKPKEHESVTLKELYTPWGETLDAAHVLEQHPNPQFMRERFQVLNGVWTCAFCKSDHEPSADLAAVVSAAALPAEDAFDQQIIVPFSPEAPLSGVNRSLQPNELLWYRRSVVAPKLQGGERLLLHFQAVDYACAVYVNGQLAGTHLGGYLPFTFDVSDLIMEGENLLLICVADPSEYGEQPRGKQRFDRGDIWYTAQSGIWQPVWWEVVPAVHIASLRFDTDIETGILAAGVRLANVGESPGVDADAGESPGADVNPDAHVSADPTSANDQLVLEVFDDGQLVARTSCDAAPSSALAVQLPSLRLWSPDDPHLYDIQLSFGDDQVRSYCAFRSVEVRTDAAGHARIMLNGEPFFIRGVLDQGYWPDGLMTAASDESLIFDIESMRAAGFNCLRKHIKVEAQRWYYHCDRLGMLVWQDMVSGGAANLNDWQFSYKPSLFRASWNRMRDTTTSNQRKLGAGRESYRKAWLNDCFETGETLINHPCIIAWTLFNEGWGQFDAARAYEAFCAFDASRPICATSGWYDQGVGEIRGVHNYFRDLAVWKQGLHGRAFVITEFGGFAHHVDKHSALDDVYGYEVYDTLAQWRQQTQALLAQADALEAEGLAGFIVTQLSDIEEETNGFLTYDRRVNKWETAAREGGAA